MLAVLTLTLAVLMLYSLGYLLSTISIWYVKLYNITMAMQALVETGRYPIPAYPTAYQAFFTFVLPVAFMTTVPAQFLTGRGTALWLLGAVAVCAALLLMSVAFWRYALTVLHEPRRVETDRLAVIRIYLTHPTPCSSSLSPSAAFV
ncbi:MAG: ABC-2 family transporter protein [Phycisphaerales bacterium]